MKQISEDNEYFFDVIIMIAEHNPEGYAREGENRLAALQKFHDIGYFF